MRSSSTSYGTDRPQLNSTVLDGGVVPLQKDWARQRVVGLNSTAGAAFQNPFVVPPSSGCLSYLQFQDRLKAKLRTTHAFAPDSIASRIHSCSFALAFFRDAFLAFLLPPVPGNSGALTDGM
mgnify:CR=1 FL=1